uniref:Ribosomal RNA-processing protein 7 C-terminal domain-containing protein n=1 Tax=Chromera velia CCMP2878 TaxID=1169474 RepID=A0A0G4HME7_9ALVE|mmetsp:Transcript_28336/g.55482  ORF Transcript_28336/g.55482 Transcript_28336/m.55482 type:complete len:281 (+) Transcript_28336:322-1164(+)|eukprot:Cvel_29113.t1-p1 / transcript=Cvel_29113.t1 / gene=Cvel_29113 / organism=Chromera_velia_CCMP2878 / gene_product=Ribosomal RNA-processing protein 7 homolog A, putative / transcript_product=Ribosomal RNA-processing protein 7 homolog A, putative / location=Cvel_scaffold3930:4232-7899(-) / protein_length=280 / sequence_SO=supercontig / SO=protein_coding / is_pseudo=false
MLVNGFHVLRVPVEVGSPFYRDLLLKRHMSQSDDVLPPDRTLFVVHVEQGVERKHLTKCFSAFGKVKHVSMKPTVKAARTPALRRENVMEVVNICHVVFEEAGSVEKTLKACRKEKGLSAASLPIAASHANEWLKKEKLRYSDADKLERDVESFMETYDKRKEEEKARQASASGALDEDGFTLVTGSSVKAPDGTVIKSARAPSAPTGAFKLPGGLSGGPADGAEGGKRRKKKRKDEALDFYRHQQREKKKQELAETRKSILEGERAVEEMRKTKKFKAL